jgi:two-component system phosphate regulon sensor histidine kinase PhoR
MLATFFGLNRFLRHSIMQEAKEDGLRQLRLVEEVLSKQPQVESIEDVQHWLKRLGTKANLRFSFIHEGGTVLADSGFTLHQIPELDDHSSRPEIIEAKKQGVGESLRYSRSKHIRFYYLAAQTERIGGLGRGFLRLAIPYAQIESRLKGMSSWFFAGLLAVLGLGALLCWLLSRQLTREVHTVAEAAELSHQGDFGKRINLYPMAEFVPLVRSVNRTAKRTQAYLSTISAHEKELEAVFNGMQEGVLVLDEQGKVKSYNESVRSLFGLTTNVAGRRTIEFIRSNELQDEIDRIRQSAEPKPKKLLLAMFQERFFNVNIIPVSLSQGGGQMIVVFHEVTELKRLEQVRRDFVANISHELRTPLTSIKGYAETLQSSPPEDPEMLQAFIGVIQRNVNNMTHLLENLLQLARLEAAESKAEQSPVNVKTALSIAWEVCEPLAGEKGIRLKNELPKTDVFVWATHEQVVRVFINLLDNAIKYSPHQEAIQVWALDEDQAWRISVLDSGPGIPRQAQQRIFERFYRVERKHDNGHVSGTGLGLSICKHILRRHGGAIWVESPAPGRLQGSVFHFRLPKSR